MQKLPLLLSSAKPFDGSDYDNHQRRAIQSWRAVTDHRTLFNDAEEIELLGDTFITPTENPPTIYEMLWYAVQMCKLEEPFAIVNSDIVLSPDFVKVMELPGLHNLGKAWAATSFRWEDGEVRGQGLDVFLMTGHIGRHVLGSIPKFLTIGRGLWDNWMNGFLRISLQPNRYFDLTPWKVVHHPLHERAAGRLSNYTDEQVKQIFETPLDARGIPSTKYPKP